MLRVPAVAVNIFARAGGGPVELIVVEPAAGRRDRHARRVASPKLFPGLDPADVETWFTRSRGAASSRVLTGRSVGDLTPEVSVRQDPGEGADYLVNHSFSWAPQP